MLCPECIGHQMRLGSDDSGLSGDAEVVRGKSLTLQLGRITKVFEQYFVMLLLLCYVLRYMKYLKTWGLGLIYVMVWMRMAFTGSYVRTMVPVGATVWEGLGIIVLLEMIPVGVTVWEALGITVLLLPCWRCLTRGRLWGFKDCSHFQRSVSCL